MAIVQNTSISRIRTNRNQNDYRSFSEYYGKRFGLDRKNVLNVSKPSDLFQHLSKKNLSEELFDKLYNTRELQVLYRLTNRLSINKKSLIGQTLFTPIIALFLIFVSEEKLLRNYFALWRKHQPHVNLQINNSLIKDSYKSVCICADCFEECIRLADKYKLLPNKTNNKDIEDTREYIKISKRFN